MSINMVAFRAGLMSSMLIDIIIMMMIIIMISSVISVKTEQFDWIE